MTDAAPPRNTLVHPIPLGHANAFLIRGTRPVLVDTGLPGNAPKILAALQEEGYKPWDLALIIITHVHTDHFGSAAALAGATGAPVLVHSGEADALTTGTTLPAMPASLLGRMLALMIGKHAPAPDLAIKPVIRIDAPYRLDAFGIDGKVVPTPGHTRGSLSVQLATGEVIIGDLVMGMLPAHKPRLPLFAEDMDAAKKSIRTILDARPTVIYTGHGGPFTRDQLEALL
jgi:glyoxylase-like metal-dependent hydrolase (beta-lactamase superfamily II)